MKPLIFATLAMFSLSAPVLAQPQQQGGAPTATQSNPQSNLAGTHADETGGGKAQNPTPHIYKRGEHLSPSYGSFDVVQDWDQFHLAKPPMGTHWVKYGNNYLLVKVDDGQITDIVKAS
ncbi:MAG TPA: RcnB family protein [Micropepsaceae bacterium]|jgi:Ni/Co efflux regulator RcnB|nr:RcnB family protein [Micropepsaceae bacterium]